MSLKAVIVLPTCSLPVLKETTFIEAALKMVSSRALLYRFLNKALKMNFSFILQTYRTFKLCSTLIIILLAQITVEQT